MNAHVQDVQTILGRIEALERQNRRLRGMAVLGLLFVTTLAVIGVAAPTRTIEGERR